MEMKKINLLSKEKLEHKGRTGHHGTRKEAPTTLLRLGLLRAWIEYRGRWRDRKRSSDAYFADDLPWVDAHVAQALCGLDGACRYEILNFSQDMILQILPASKHLEDGVGKVLLGAILYAYKDPLGLTYLPSTLITRIQRYERNHGITIKVKQIKLILRKKRKKCRFCEIFCP